jgi:hypothetical protein
MKTPAWKTALHYVLSAALLVGCAGMERECASCNAESYGADWIIVQYRNDGQPMNCWRLRETSVTNEPGSDGIYWKGPHGHLVHISGHYNRVQVMHGDYEGAAKSIGIDLAACQDGRYLAKPAASAQ